MPEFTVHVMESGHREVTDYPQRFATEGEATTFAKRVLALQRSIKSDRYLAIQKDRKIVSYVGD